eukprot:1193215-Prorocentrum_minimum.AAC.2
MMGNRMVKCLRECVSYAGRAAALHPSPTLPVKYSYVGMARAPGLPDLGSRTLKGCALASLAEGERRVPSALAKDIQSVTVCVDEPNQLSSLPWGGNDFASGGLTVMAAGTVLALTKKLLEVLWELAKRQFLVRCACTSLAHLNR